jgi:hypothetical protein
MAITTKTIAILAIASVFGFGSLVVFSEIYLSVGSGLLDGRLNGYDVEAVTRYLALLSAEDLQFYIGPFRALDTIVPPLLAATFTAIIWTLGSTLWSIMVVFPLIYVIADLRENALVGQILQGNTLDAETVSRASDMTQLKSLFIVMSLAVVLWLWRQGRTQA